MSARIPTHYEDAPRIVDISPRISARLGVFPGDTPFTQEVALDFERGHNLKLSSLRSTVHLGAHADAPSHYSPGGIDIESVDLARYLGPCEVVRARHVEDSGPAGIRGMLGPGGRRVGLAHLPPGWVPCAPRVLVRTDTFLDPETWNSNFAALEPEFVTFLATHGVVLVGIDTPSVDPEDSKALETHGAIARAGLSILEGLVLAHVEPGVYTLVALPLPLEGFDASPVRAVLLPAGAMGEFGTPRPRRAFKHAQEVCT
jgi:arylformamidase